MPGTTANDWVNSGLWNWTRTRDIVQWVHCNVERGLKVVNLCLHRVVNGLLGPNDVSCGVDGPFILVVDAI